jgi:hypothetical protein
MRLLVQDKFSVLTGILQSRNILNPRLREH